MEEEKEKAKQLQEDNNQIKRDRASELPRIDGVVHLAHKSLRLFVATASLGGYTAAEKVSQVRLQTEKLEKKQAKIPTWCEATDQMALAEKILAGNMRMCPRTQALNLVEGTAAHSEEIWAMFTTEWNEETRESEILVLQKATIDPHFVPWLKGKDQYTKYMNKGWRMWELGEYMSMTTLQKKTMEASLPRGMYEYPKAWTDAWKIKDGPIVPLDVIRKYYMDKHIAWDEKYTSTYNSSKVSAGIGLDPDDNNWSDRDDQYTLKPFPTALRTKEWGFDRHGVVKLTKRRRLPCRQARGPRRRRPSSKVSDDEAEATDHFTNWYEVDEAEVRATKYAKLTDAEFKQYTSRSMV
jgi:hypothetical protein